METVLRLLNGEENWEATGVLTDEEALQKFQAENFDLVLIGGGVDEESEQSLSMKFKQKAPATKIIRHYGGGSGLLFGEILEAMKN